MLQSEHATSACNSPLQHLHSPDQFKSPGLYGAFLSQTFAAFTFVCLFFSLLFFFALVLDFLPSHLALARHLIYSSEEHLHLIGFPQTHCMLGFISCIHLAILISPFERSFILRVVDPFFVFFLLFFFCTKLHQHACTICKHAKTDDSVTFFTPVFIISAHTEGAWYAVFKKPG